MDSNDFVNPNKELFEIISRMAQENMSLPPDIYNPLVERALEVTRPHIFDVSTDLWKKTSISSTLPTWNFTDQFASDHHIGANLFQGPEWDVIRKEILDSTALHTAGLFDHLDLESFLPQMDFSSFVRGWADLEKTGTDNEDPTFIDEIASRLDKADPVETKEINKDAQSMAAELLKSMEMRAALVHQLNTSIVSLMAYMTETAPCRFLAVERNRAAVIAFTTAALPSLATTIAPGVLNFILAIVGWIASWALDRFRQENCPDYLLD